MPPRCRISPSSMAGRTALPPWRRAPSMAVAEADGPGADLRALEGFPGELGVDALPFPSDPLASLHVSDHRPVGPRAPP